MYIYIIAPPAPLADCLLRLPLPIRVVALARVNLEVGEMG